MKNWLDESSNLHHDQIWTCYVPEFYRVLPRFRPPGAMETTIAATHRTRCTVSTLRATPHSSLATTAAAFRRHGSTSIDSPPFQIDGIRSMSRTQTHSSHIRVMLATIGSTISAFDDRLLVNLLLINYVVQALDTTVESGYIIHGYIIQLLILAIFGRNRIFT